jgi:L-rhamnose mutarotase
MKLKPGMKEEYRRRHNAIWPELVDLLRQSGIRDYSIFLDEQTNTLFAFQKLDGDSSAQDLGDEPVVQRWWAHMADIMETHPNNAPITTPLEEVFHME